MSSSRNQFPSTPSMQESFMVVWGFARPFKKELFLILILGILSAIANGAVPYISGRFFDSLIGLSRGEPNAVAGVALWTILLFVWAGVQFIANGVDWIIDRYRRDVNVRLHSKLVVDGFVHLLKLPLMYHKGAHISGVLQKIGNAGWRVSAIVRTIIQIAPQFLSVLIGVTLAASINPYLAGILALGVVIYSMLVVRMVLPIAAVDDKAHRVWNDAWDDAAQAVYQVESVKQAASEQYESHKVQTGFHEKVYALERRLERHWNNINFFQRMIVFLTQLAVFVASISLVSNGSLTVGELIALNGYAMMFFGPFVQLGHSWQTIQNGLTSAVHVQEIYDEKSEIYEPEDAILLGGIRGDIEFVHVTFQYGPDQPVILNGIDFQVHAGDVVALVGESGVGKSTAISLISGYTFPTRGDVLIDGITTKRHNLNSLRKHIAVVPQEVALFNSTIRENIRYGTFNATDEKIEDVAREAHLLDYIDSLPSKFDTLVGERGVKLSVGQKQRVAIARAMLRNPSILILDEPTSALDAKTEQIITASLEKLMKGRTTFIIAHRLSTVRKADTILVFDKGKVVESGTHDELIRKPGGVYQRLYEYQIGLHE